MNKVFISYAWGGESEGIANALEKTFQEKGIRLVRDKTDLGYKDLIREFMQQIGQGKCVVLIISDKYLKSKNCMFELLEISRNGDFYDRIFPIVLSDVGIYDAKKRLYYIKYWEDKIKSLDEAMRGVNSANLQGVREEIDLYTEIRHKIASLVNTLQNMNALTIEMHKEADFEEVLDKIKRKLEENLQPSDPNWRIVNRHDERNLLKEMIDGKIKERILVIRGEGTLGKTFLLHQFERQNAILSPIYIDLKSGTITPAEIFCNICERLGWQFFQNFEKRINSLQNNRKDPNANYTEERIRDILLPDDERLRRGVLATLTETFFEDLGNLRQPTIVLFDTYEKASDELCGWFEEFYLPKSERCKNLILVIAGRNTPRTDLGWICQFRELNAIDSPDDWQRYCEQQGLPLDKKLVKVICEISRGNPKQVAEAIHLLKREEQ